MSAVDPKILAKIKKCLALGGSPNPHEAATAMRQAHALMRMHGVDAHHVAMTEIGESSAGIRTMSRDKPAHWEAALAATVGKAFGCQMLISRTMYPKAFRKHVNEGQFIFIGQKGQAEVAAYTVSVLARKCKAARQKWIADHLAGLPHERGGKSQVTRMGDAFAEGWVHSIGKLVADFANPTEIEQAIERHIAEKNVGTDAPTRKIKTDDIGRGEMIAARMGSQAAKGESLYRPMHASAPRAAVCMEGCSA